MARRENGKPETRRSVSFDVQFDRQPEEAIYLSAYLFDQQGNLIARAPLREGKVDFRLAPTAINKARLFIAPEPRETEKLSSIEDMQRVKAYEPLFEYDPERFSYELLPIPYEIWKFWLLCSCRVRGRVVKPVTIFGITIERPVCDAKVHICEVDRLIFIIPRLPDFVILRLRDELLKELQKPPLLLRKPPFPPPPPVKTALAMFPVKPDLPANMLEPQLAGISKMKRKHLNWLNPQPEPPADFSIFETDAGLDRPGEQVSLNPQPLPPGEQVGLNPQPLPPKMLFDQLPVTVQSGLMSESINVLKDTLASQAMLILPYLCLWPWFWPYVCTCDELTTVITNHSGRFDTTIWFHCFGDHPDLYFWVEYPIGGVWETVYHPTICCHTYWNYVCGSEVTLRVTDPRVQGCQPINDLPGLQVVITTIGNGVSMSEIQPLASATPGLTTDGRPFAGTLELRMDLSRSNLIAAGIPYYRWSYRRLTQGDGVTPVVDGWHSMTRGVWRSYKILGPGGIPQYPMEPMGPSGAFPLADIIKIQPVAPPPGAIEWSVQNEHYDLASAYFETASLYEADTVTPAAGLYELKLELFDAAGGLVNWSNPAATIAAFESSNAAPFTPPVGMTTAPAAPAHLITDVGGDVWGFKLVVHVDNHHCQAVIYDTWVDLPANAAGPCGFINFADRITSHARLSFWAYHPHNFAQFCFTTVKGSSGYVAAACAGWVGFPVYAPVGSGMVNGFARTPASVFWMDFLVSTLLDANGVVCPAAAFGENLYVDAFATDGYQIADWLDAYALPKAFALSP